MTSPPHHSLQSVGANWQRWRNFIIHDKLDNSELLLCRVSAPVPEYDNNVITLLLSRGLIITHQSPAPSYYRLSGQNACNTPFMTQTSVAFQTVVRRLGIQQFVSLLIECPRNQSLTTLAHHHLVSLLLSGGIILVRCRGIKLGLRSQVLWNLSRSIHHKSHIYFDVEISLMAICFFSWIT